MTCDHYGQSGLTIDASALKRLREPGVLLYTTQGTVFYGRRRNPSLGFCAGHASILRKGTSTAPPPPPTNTTLWPIAKRIVRMLSFYRLHQRQDKDFQLRPDLQKLGHGVTFGIQLDLRSGLN